MKVGNLVTHKDMPEHHRCIGVVVEVFTDLNTCSVVWADLGSESMWHFKDSLELISESW